MSPPTDLSPTSRQRLRDLLERALAALHAWRVAGDEARIAAAQRAASAIRERLESLTADDDDTVDSSMPRTTLAEAIGKAAPFDPRRHPRGIGPRDPQGNPGRFAPPGSPTSRPTPPAPAAGEHRTSDPSTLLDKLRGLLDRAQRSEAGWAKAGDPRRQAAAKLAVTRIRRRIRETESAFNFATKRPAAAGTRQPDAPGEGHTVFDLADVGHDDEAAAKKALANPQNPSVPRDELAKLLAAGKVVAEIPLGIGINAASLVRLDNDTYAVQKHDKDAQPDARASVPGNFSGREAAAADIAGIIGLCDLVPTTTAEGGTSRQAFVKDADPGIGPHAWNFEERDHARAAAFDFLILNTDRHGKNWLTKPREDGSPIRQLVLIDHGFSFPTDHHVEEFANSRVLGRAIEQDMQVPDEVREWAGHWDDMERVLRLHRLTDQEIMLTAKRLSHLTNSKHKTFADVWQASGITLLDEVNEVMRKKQQQNLAPWSNHQ